MSACARFGIGWSGWLVGIEGWALKGGGDQKAEDSLDLKNEQNFENKKKHTLSGDGDHSPIL